MQTKLTLRLDDNLIEQAKRYAKQNDKSLSQVVADYFQFLNQKKQPNKIPPITRSLIGLLESQQGDEEEYKKHLEQKYL
ncbi:MAG: DUF6364 family protein [Gammaproteobacteria bacterium]|nr:DUF6364 family protein [Gammaproteobacteria bacterium]